MPEFLLKYADPNGGVHERIEESDSEQTLRRRYVDDGLLVYSIKPRRKLAELAAANSKSSRRLHLEQFLIFNQQFVTLIRAGLPILKSLELLKQNIRNKRLREAIETIHDAVREGTPLSEAFRAQDLFPPIYVTSLMAGEKSGSLPEVIERYVQYQKVSLSVRKKIIVSLIYPAVLVGLVLALVVFLVAYVVPEFASLYESMDAELPGPTQLLIAIGVTFSENFLPILLAIVALAGVGWWWLRTGPVQDVLDRLKLRTPLLGAIWTKYQVSQLCRLLSTLLEGGIPLMTALETTGDSLTSKLMREAVQGVRKKVKEGRALSSSLQEANIFPPLAIEMIQVGESTGALPAMLNSVAEFFDEDVENATTAAMSLIEPAIMIFMGIFVAFVLISLYLPMFSLAEQL